MCNTIQYNTIQYCKIEYNTIQYNTKQQDVTQYKELRYDQHKTKLCNTLRSICTTKYRINKKIRKIVKHKNRKKEID